MPIEGIVESANHEMDRKFAFLGPDLPKKFRLDYNTADWVHEKIAEQIKEFEDQLDKEHEIAMMLAGFGQPVMMLVEDIGFQNPNLLYFYGTVDGKETQLIQHMSQLNFVLMSVPKQPDKPARRIGFQLNEDREEVK